MSEEGVFERTVTWAKDDVLESKVQEDDRDAMAYANPYRQDTETSINDDWTVLASEQDEQGFGCDNLAIRGHNDMSRDNQCTVFIMCRQHDEADDRDRFRERDRRQGKSTDKKKRKRKGGRTRKDCTWFLKGKWLDATVCAARLCGETN